MYTNAVHFETCHNVFILKHWGQKIILSMSVYSVLSFVLHGFSLLLHPTLFYSPRSFSNLFLPDLSRVFSQKEDSASSKNPVEKIKLNESKYYEIIDYICCNGSRKCFQWRPRLSSFRNKGKKNSRKPPCHCDWLINALMSCLSYTQQQIPMNALNWKE